jgi:hypothetical protein
VIDTFDDVDQPCPEVVEVHKIQLVRRLSGTDQGEESIRARAMTWEMMEIYFRPSARASAKSPMVMPHAFQSNQCGTFQSRMRHGRGTLGGRELDVPMGLTQARWYKSSQF